MSRPTAISPEEQEQIARRIGVLLLQAAPEDWQQITVEYRATGEYHDLLGEVVSQDGSSYPWEPPEDLLSIFEHLREGMYRPDVGTWLSALYIVERPSSYRIDINFDSEPRWRRPLPRAAYVDELRRYPRADENVPDWMREKLEGSGSTAQPDSAPQAPEAIPQPAAGSAAPEVNGLGAASPDVQLTQGPPADPGTPPATQGIPQSQNVAQTPNVAQPQDVPGTQGMPQAQGVPEPQDVTGAQDPSGAPGVPGAQDIPGTQGVPGVQGVPGTQGVPGGQGDAAPAMSAAQDVGSPAANTPAEMGVPAESREEPATYAANGSGPAANGEHFRIARVFDDFDEQGLPVVASRPAVPTEEAVALRNYLEHAKLVLSSQDYAEDLLDLERSNVVPTTWHTDGVWVWEGAVAYYFAQYGLPPEPDLVEHVRQQRFTLSEPDEHTWNAAASAVLNQLDSEDGASEPELGTQLTDQEQESGHVPAESTSDSAGLADAAAADAGAAEQAGLAEQAEPTDRAADVHEHAGEEDSGDVLARLHDKFSEHAVDGDRYRIGSHSAGARCLVQEGPDWVVTPGPEGTDEADLRFERAEQAAAYLLGSLLLSAPERSAAPEPGPVESAPAESPEPEREYPPIGDLPRRGAPAQEQRVEQSPGGHFLFTANQGPAEEISTAQPPTPDPMHQQPGTQQPAAQQYGPQQQGTQQYGMQQPAAQQYGAQPGASAAQEPHLDPPDQQAQRAEQDGAPGEAPTRYRPLPPTDRPGPPPGPASPPTGQPMGDPASQGVANGQPQQGPNGAAGQAPPPLPKRPPRTGQGGGPAPQAGGNQPQPAPNGQAQPGPNGAPPQPGPPPQGAAPGGRPPQPTAPAGGQPQAPGGQGGPPPQGGPNGAQPQVGQEQQIQPLRGEPPLTLYRDRHNVVLQPGTEVDRFGEPGGNVAYASRTPYSQRSLPPQWSNRTYRAYRVQRPLQVLKGTAVPWFEQPGGGTAYVLPAAISDLLADGALVELSGSEAPPRPSMD